jgi:hypothetical protein
MDSEEVGPISLIHGAANLVAKVLANRVAPILPQMVGVRATECIHSWKVLA